MKKKSNTLIRFGSTSVTIQDINRKKSDELRIAVDGLARLEKNMPRRTIGSQREVLAVKR